MKSNFERAAGSLLDRYNELSDKTKEALELSEKGMYEAAEAAMGDVIRMAEKVALVSRKLPAHTGNPNAQTEVQRILGECDLVQVGFIMRDWFYMRMPPLASQKDLASKEYIRGLLYPAMYNFWLGKPVARMPESVIVFCHVYAYEQPRRRMRDYDNVEVKLVTDTIAMHLLEDDCPDQCQVFHCTASGKETCTEVYVIPQDDFTYWYAGYCGVACWVPHVRENVPGRWRK